MSAKSNQPLGPDPVLHDTEVILVQLGRVPGLCVPHHGQDHVVRGGTRQVHVELHEAVGARVEVLAGLNFGQTLSLLSEREREKFSKYDFVVLYINIYFSFRLFIGFNFCVKVFLY